MMGRKFDDDLICRIKNMRMGGMSVKHIASQLRIAVGSASKYCKGLRHNNKPPGNAETALVASLAAKKIWDTRKHDVNAWATKRWPKMRTNTKVVSLIALYWAEGSKRHHESFRVTNSDPGVIAICADALKELGDYDYKLYITVYKGQNVEYCKKQWQSHFPGVDITMNVRIPRTEHKLYSKHGVCSLYVRRSYKLWHSVMTWIGCWRKEFGINESWQM